MSVIVKGMRMPITCAMCDLAHAMKTSDGLAKLACGATGRWQDEYRCRPSWCPLVELTEEDTIKLSFQNWKSKEAEESRFLVDAMEKVINLPSAQPVIHCWECIYYDPEHIENKGVRYEYEDMPKDAFDILGTGLVNLEYGINVGGRCCRDYNVGYSEDKRVFVSKQNYCGRAERRTDG